MKKMDCCDLPEMVRMANLCKIKHHSIDIECGNCGYMFPHIERDEALYVVDRVLHKMRCPVCDAGFDELFVTDIISQDKFETWSGVVNITNIRSDEEVVKMIEEARNVAGNA